MAYTWKGQTITIGVRFKGVPPKFPFVTQVEFTNWVPLSIGVPLSSSGSWATDHLPMSLCAHLLLGILDRRVVFVEFQAARTRVETEVSEGSAGNSPITTVLPINSWWATWYSCSRGTRSRVVSPIARRSAAGPSSALELFNVVDRFS